MQLNRNDLVRNTFGRTGIVTETDDLMARVEFNNGRVGWFDRADDDRVSVVGVFRAEQECK